MDASRVFCSSCGASGSPNNRFCEFCGSILQATNINVSANPTIPSTHTPPFLEARGEQDETQALLHQRYYLLHRLGKGGMGVVYQAQDTLLGNRLVAVKEMSQDSLSEQPLQEAIANFKREAHLLAGLQHPNLPSIYDHFAEDGRWYLVMSFIQGETLEDYLTLFPGQRLSFEETIQIGLTLCNVLDYLHSHQPPIIFRDLKPANIMRTTNGHIYLIDFGIARHFKPGQTRDTNFFVSMGYAPLEQFGHGQTTVRSDIYSLGATLHRLLSGYNPRLSPFHLPPLQALVPTLPEPLTRLITQMLELEESRRPANIKVVQHELLQIATPLLSIPQSISSPPTDTKNSARVSNQSSVTKKMLSLSENVLRTIGIIAGGALVLLAIIGAFFGGTGIFNNLWVADIIFFFGAIIFSIASIRSSSPLSSRRKTQAIIGTSMSIIAIACGMTIVIVAAITIQANQDNSGGIVGGITSIIEGLLLWLVTRIPPNKQAHR